MANAKTQRLVIVESPAKAKTISGYLGPGYVVEASYGHVRDLPRNAADVPAKHKGEAWARLGVDVDNDFAALYVVTPDRTKQVTRLKSAAQGLRRTAARHGRGPRGRGHRLAPGRDAQAQGADPADGLPRDHPVGDPAGGGQPARDRPVAGRRPGGAAHPRPALRLRGLPGAVEEGHARGLSAGRVQSVATRIVVQRERERMALPRPPSTGTSGPSSRSPPTRSRTGARTFAGHPGLARRRPDRHRQGLRPGHRPVRAGAGVVHLDGDGARGLAARLENRPFEVVRVEEKPYRRRPYAPFITSTLQQEAGTQAAVLVRADHAHRAAAVRERLHHLYAYRLGEPVRDGDRGRPDPDRRAVRRPVRAAAAAPVHRQGQERPGGARGDPPGRRRVPDPGRGGQRAVHRGVQALRADLAAHDRVPDDRRGRLVGVGADPGDLDRRTRSATSPRPARRSPIPASSRRTWSPPTTPTPRPTTSSTGCRT